MEIFTGHLLEKASNSDNLRKKLEAGINQQKKINKVKKIKEEVPKVKNEKQQESGRDPAENRNHKSTKERIYWPKANSKEWGRLDEDMSKLLNYIDPVPEKKAESHPRVIYQNV